MKNEKEIILCFLSIIVCLQEQNPVIRKMKEYWKKKEHKREYGQSVHKIFSVKIKLIHKKIHKKN